MTRALEQRIARLEVLFGIDGCVCDDVPAYVVIREDGDDEVETSANVEAQLAPYRSRCPVHGEREPALVVQLRRFGKAA